MELWQMDVMGRAFLVDGRAMKFVTGIDNHSRFVVCARVVRTIARPACDALVWALRTQDRVPPTGPRSGHELPTQTVEIPYWRATSPSD